MNNEAPMWAMRQNCISPGRIAIEGLIWPLSETSWLSPILACLMSKKRSGMPRSNG